MDIKKGLKVVGVVALGALAAISAAHDALEQPDIEYINTTQIHEVEVEVEKEVVVEKVVEVDNGDLSFTLERLEDKEIIEDAKEVVEELKAEDAALAMAIEAVKAEFEDEDFREELEDKGIIEDEDEVRIVEIFNDFEDVEVVRSDFDRESYKFEIKVEIEDLEEEEYKDVIATVKVYRGRVEVLKVE